MSNKNKKSLYGQPSTQIRQLFDEACHKLGMEIRNEARSIENQIKLRESLSELEKAFTAAVEREQEAAQAKARDEERKKQFQAKADAANGKTETPAATPAPVEAAPVTTPTPEVQS